MIINNFCIFFYHFSYKNSKVYSISEQRLFEHFSKKCSNKRHMKIPPCKIPYCSCLAVTNHTLLLDFLFHFLF